MYKSGYEQNWLDPDWEVGYTTLRQLVNPNLGIPRGAVELAFRSVG